MRFIKFLFFFFFVNHLLSLAPREKLIPSEQNQEFLPDSAIHKAIFEPAPFPCNECVKLMDKYVKKCSNIEIQGEKVPTFLSFCESLGLDRDPKYNSSTYKFCLDIHQSLLEDRKQPDTNKPNYTPYEVDSPDLFFFNYKRNCDKFNLPTPECYIGLCEKLVECIDCPYGLNEIDSEGNLEYQVCSGHGICRLGWLNEKKKKGGNGFCECFDGRKGLACDQIPIQGFKPLPTSVINIKKMEK